MKKLPLTHYLIMLLLMIGTISLQANPTKNDWKLYTQEKGIQIYYQEADCDDPDNGLFQTMYLFKVVNTTQFDVEINWKAERYYGEECSNCDDKSAEHTTQFTIKANSELLGDCKEGDLHLFIGFKNYDHIKKLSKFELVNIQIKPLL